MGGVSLSPLVLPVPHDVKVPYARPGRGHGSGAHSQDLALPDPAPAQVLATGWVIRKQIQDYAQIQTIHYHLGRWTCRPRAREQRNRRQGWTRSESNNGPLRAQSQSVSGLCKVSVRRIT